MRGKTTLVTSMYNQNISVLETLDKLFFPSLLKNGNKNIGILILDDCSPLRRETEELVNKYTSKLMRAFAFVKFLRNKTNLGFAGSFNKGIRLTQTKYILIANDDLYFPAGSIKRLISTLNEKESYGLVGPISNNKELWSYQYCRQAPKIKSYKPEEIKKLDLFSSWLQKEMTGQRMVTDNICGFCFAADTAFLKSFNGFTEKYQHGYYEDTDLIQRIIKEHGLGSVAINMEVFIGHGGVNGASQSFKQLPLKMVKSLIVNSFKYAKTWGYLKLLRRFIYGTLSQLGYGTISSLLPRKILL